MSTQIKLQSHELGSREAFRAEITRQMLIDIFNGKLAAGTRLVIQKLATQFGISTTPVRESLVELEAAGLIHYVYNCGVVVRPFGPEQLGEIYQVRRILEVEATRCACRHLDPDALEEFRKQSLELDEARKKRKSNSSNYKKWSAKALTVDRAFHMLIARHCANDRLCREIVQYDLLIQTIAEVVGNRLETQTRGVLEHLKIIEKLLAGDAEGAAKEMAEHIEHTSRDIVAIMFPEDGSSQA